MRAAFCFSGLLFVLAVAHGAGAASLGPQTEELLDLDVTTAKYPDEDRVVLYQGIDLTMDDDGRLTRRVRTVSRLLTDLAIEHYGDERVAFDTTRQELAEQYVREGRYSLSQIAYLLGFSDQSNFSRAFRRWTGQSPGSYSR